MTEKSTKDINEEAYHEVMAIIRSQNIDMFGHGMSQGKGDIEDQDLLYKAVGHSPNVLKKVCRQEWTTENTLASTWDTPYSQTLEHFSPYECPIPCTEVYTSKWPRRPSSHY